MKTALFLCANFLSLLLPWGFAGAQQPQGIRRRMTTEEDSEGILSKMWNSGANTWVGQIIGRSDCDTPAPTTASPTTLAPTTAQPTPTPTPVPVPTTSSPTTASPTTPSPTTPSPTTARPTTSPPTRPPTHLSPETCEYTGPARKSFSFRNELQSALEQAIAALAANDRSAQVFQDYGYPVGAWDVSKVTTFESLFLNLRENVNLIGDLNCWDTSQVTNMHLTFGFTYFNGDVSTWDTSKVRSMKYIFAHSYPNQNTNTIFKGDAFKNWNTGSVQDMSYAFSGSRIEDLEIEDWDVSSVTNFEGMFEYSHVSPDLGRWNTGSATSMKNMFQSTTNFNSNIGGWDVSNVADFAFMFRQTEVSPALAGWNTGKATSMSGMFGRSAFNSDIGAWDMSNVEFADGMFGYARSFNQDISRWDMSNLKVASNMFSNALTFNQDISDWNVGKLYDAKYMFKDANSFNQDLCEWRAHLPPFSGNGNYFSWYQAFTETSCPSVADPTSLNGGPFCHTCS